MRRRHRRDGRRDGDVSQLRSYPSAHGGSSAQAGWEYVLGLGLEREAPRVAEQAAALLRAPVLPAGRDDRRDRRRADGRCRCTSRSAIRPSSTASTAPRPPTPARASSARATSARCATAPSTDEHHRRPDDARRRSARSASTTRASRPSATPIVEGGILRGFLTSRETAARIGSGARRLDARRRLEPDAARADDNLHLEPGEGTLEDLLADVDDGIYFETNKSWSIDDKRLNFQFGTQIAWEIKQGKLGRMLRDATYTGVTPVFWGSLDAVAGPETWRCYGLTNCGKGQPGQHAHVSHGAAPARFRNVQVGVAPS